jgi:hypothetical protein
MNSRLLAVGIPATAFVLTIAISLWQRADAPGPAAQVPGQAPAQVAPAQVAPGTPATATAAPSPPSPSMGGERSVGQAAPAPRTVAVTEPAVTTRGDLRTPAGVMRVMPDVDGWSTKLRGFRIYPGRDASAFAKTGLLGGDLVIAVNGTSLAGLDPKAGQQILEAMKTSSQTTLTVELNGQTRDVTIDMTEEDQ